MMSQLLKSYDGFSSPVSDGSVSSEVDDVSGRKTDSKAEQLQADLNWVNDIRAEAHDHPSMRSIIEEIDKIMLKMTNKLPSMQNLTQGAFITETASHDKTLRYYINFLRTIYFQTFQADEAQEADSVQSVKMNRAELHYSSKLKKNVKRINKRLAREFELILKTKDIAVIPRVGKPVELFPPSIRHNPTSKIVQQLKRFYKEDSVLPGVMEKFQYLFKQDHVVSKKIKQFNRTMTKMDRQRQKKYAAKHKGLKRQFSQYNTTFYRPSTTFCELEAHAIRERAKRSEEEVARDRLRQKFEDLVEDCIDANDDI